MVHADKLANDLAALQKLADERQTQALARQLDEKNAQLAECRAQIEQAAQAAAKQKAELEQSKKACQELGEKIRRLETERDAWGFIARQAAAPGPDHPLLVAAHAEKAMCDGVYDEAVRHWQHLANLLGKQTPQLCYDRLGQAYRSLRQFPCGTSEEEALRGSRDKYELLAHIHQRLCPKFYLEIGVQTGKSLALARGRALGVDPIPQVARPLPDTICVIKTTSDSFFAGQPGALLEPPPDLVFIDGMHLFEYALRDFVNVERYASCSTLVVIDDVYPGHPVQAHRNRRTRAWTGDVWKVMAALEQYRPDLFLQALDAYPTGLLLVAGLDPANTNLDKRYDEVVAHYAGVETVPDAVLARAGAWACDDPRFEQVLEQIARAMRNPGAEPSLAERLNAVKNPPRTAEP